MAKGVTTSTYVTLYYIHPVILTIMSWSSANGSFSQGGSQEAASQKIAIPTSLSQPSSSSRFPSLRPSFPSPPTLVPVPSYPVSPAPSSKPQ